jgi:hypothetical protein
MENIWYRNPKILLQNLDQFFPNKTLSRVNKLNALARFAIYYSLLVIILRQDTKWMSVSLIILLITIFMGSSERFNSIDPILNNEVCQEPSKHNPFMNFTVSDLVDNPKRKPACDYESTKNKIRANFRSHLHTDMSDIWGRFISDRNFYTMPNTNIVNDQTGFAKWCFGDSGACKSEGRDCIKLIDPAYASGRLTYVKDDQEK